jgi:hypothetical protein
MVSVPRRATDVTRVHTRRVEDQPEMVGRAGATFLQFKRRDPGRRFWAGGATRGAWQKQETEEGGQKQFEGAGHAAPPLGECDREVQRRAAHAVLSDNGYAVLGWKFRSQCPRKHPVGAILIFYNRPLETSLSYAKLKMGRRVGRWRKPVLVFRWPVAGRQIRRIVALTCENHSQLN